jgi:hypothetical protein
MSMQAGMGDESKDSMPLNKFYDAEIYQQFSAATRRNLARVDENRIDYDLLEALMAHIDAEHGEGAILVFLPGVSLSLSPFYLCACAGVSVIPSFSTSVVCLCLCVYVYAGVHVCV